MVKINQKIVDHFTASGFSFIYVGLIIKNNFRIFCILFLNASLQRKKCKKINIGRKIID